MKESEQSLYSYEEDRERQFMEEKRIENELKDAIRLEQDNKWDDALAIYDRLANDPHNIENRQYVKNSAKSLREKMNVAGIEEENLTSEESYENSLKASNNIFSFAGRITRSRYNIIIFLGFVFLCLSTYVIPAILYNAYGWLSILLLVVYACVAIAIFWCVQAANSKRCHDRNKNANFGLIKLIPLIGHSIFYFEMIFSAGTKGSNIYGPDMVTYNFKCPICQANSQYSYMSIDIIQCLTCKNEIELISDDKDKNIPY
ncbi:MAG: DUF805 domain-containing protein [Phycisphaerae bacterium]|nr:DUF805 domain-containing protein [Phycisphaerae bacterium]